MRTNDYDSNPNYESSEDYEGRFDYYDRYSEDRCSVSDDFDLCYNVDRGIFRRCLIAVLMFLISTLPYLTVMVISYFILSHC